MTRTMTDLLDLARTVQMSADDAEAQRRSFAYGNTAIENADITRDMIDEAALRLDRSCMSSGTVGNAS